MCICDQQCNLDSSIIIVHVFPFSIRDEELPATWDSGTLSEKPNVLNC